MGRGFGPFSCMHWLHSADQIVYRLGASCFTHTEFARVLYELREDRKHAMSIAFAESQRSAFRQTGASEIVKDSQETKANKLRAEATLIEDGARALLARPSFVAAQIELGIIETLIPLLQFESDNVPYTFHECQRHENTVALFWKAYVEHQTFSQISFDTRSEILSRGIGLPNFDNISTRDAFLDTFHAQRVGHKALFSHDLEHLYVAAMNFVKASPLLERYREALTDADKNTVFLGTIPQGIRALEPVAEDKRLSSAVPSRKPRRK